ncbi:hypothetical protein [Christiangramia forsetii]|uniref:Adenylosuccinate lyase n=2 Tax=Christiangramia forsetii TaxID=411153 RepID=A0M0C2_CHRFK|nr:hypothetical protein [Christiangramia forsetii]GGG41276.1 hypothetical protein GCM10011532_26260 [Christiangramia forsetii]CAL66067.1 hypothetical protein GFO_1093 [Christiangramia forsetii KT0803]
MNGEKLLLNMDLSIAERRFAANLILENQDLLDELIVFINKNESKLALLALRAIEVLAQSHFEIIHKFIPELIHSGKLYSDSSSRRCLAKIYGFAIKENSNKISGFKLTSELKKEIIELSFLWLISIEKTAVKVFSMQNIYDLKMEEHWIAQELIGVIEKEFPNSSQGFKPRAIKILRKLRE